MEVVAKKNATIRTDKPQIPEEKKLLVNVYKGYQRPIRKRWKRFNGNLRLSEVEMHTEEFRNHMHTHSKVNSGNTEKDSSLFQRLIPSAMLSKCRRVRQA